MSLKLSKKGPAVVHKHSDCAMYELVQQRHTGQAIVLCRQEESGRVQDIKDGSKETQKSKQPLTHDGWRSWTVLHAPFITSRSAGHF
jgi:hypothetical protein